jgi:hypothetical protein
LKNKKTSWKGLVVYKSRFAEYQGCRRNISLRHLLKGCTSLKRRGNWKLDEMTLSRNHRTKNSLQPDMKPKRIEGVQECIEGLSIKIDITHMTQSFDIRLLDIERMKCLHSSKVLRG